MAIKVLRGYILTAVVSNGLAGVGEMPRIVGQVP